MNSCSPGADAVPAPAGSTVAVPLPEVRLQLSSFATRVSGDSLALLEELASLYPTARLARTPRPRNGPARFAALEERRNGSGSVYRLLEDGRELYRLDTAAGAVGQLEWMLGGAAIPALADFLILHAGLVATRTGGVLIPGTSGAGKSTLVAALSLAGFRYLTDEVAPLDVETLAAQPFHKSICLRPGGWRALSAAFSPPTSIFEGHRIDGEPIRYLRPVPPIVAGRRTRIRYILLPVRRAGAAATLTPISRASTLADLARNSCNVPRHGLAGFEALARLVESARCYTLSYDGLREAVAAVSALTHHRPSVTHHQ